SSAGHRHRPRHAAAAGSVSTPACPPVGRDVDNTLAPLLRLPGMILDDYAADMTGRGLAPQAVAARMTLATRLYREWGRLDVPPTRIAAWLAAYQGWSRYTY